MTTPEPSEPQPSRPSGPPESSETPDAPDARKPAEPAEPDRVYRSPAGIAGGALMLALSGWFGIDAVVQGEGRTPWLSLAALLLVVPLVVAFTLRPAVYANGDRLRVRNPFRLVVLPWGQVVELRSGYTNEVVDRAGTRYQLWAVPVSLRARKRAARRDARAAAHGDPPGGAPQTPVRAGTDQIMDELRARREGRAAAPEAQGAVTVRWAYEVLAPAITGAVLLAVLLALG
ncbi:PH domain-containing protein [Streptomyces sp. NPDC005925]|uniref:PH domain-containing protein n=1 Tax=Streptomyces sp. NPDC005925 TaxID=3157172 RepID=UPI0033CDFAAB